MKTIFSHGKESGPNGSKIQRLAKIAADFGGHIESIDYTDLTDPDLRVERLVAALKNAEDDVVLVGSSMGGYVSLVASGLVDPEQVKGLFLLAPALFMPGYQRQTYPGHDHLEIVHGWSDTVIPPEHSLKFAQSSGCTLHLIAGDHRLNSSLAAVERLFAGFMASLPR